MWENECFGVTFSKSGKDDIDNEKNWQKRDGNTASSTVEQNLSNETSYI